MLFSICIKSKNILYNCFSSCIRSKNILYNLFFSCIKSKNILYNCFSSCIRSKSILYNWDKSCIRSKNILYNLILTPKKLCIKCVIFGKWAISKSNCICTYSELSCEFHRCQPIHSDKYLGKSEHSFN